MFCIYLRTNNDLCNLHHKLIGFYNRDEKCLLHGTNYGFKLSSLCCVFERLITYVDRTALFSHLDRILCLDYIEQNDAGRVRGPKSRGAVTEFRMI